MRPFTFATFAILAASAVAAPPSYRFTVVEPYPGDTMASAISVDSLGRVLIQSTTQGLNGWGDAHLFVRNADGSVRNITPDGAEKVNRGLFLRGHYVVGVNKQNKYFRYDLDTNSTELLTIPVGAQGMIAEELRSDGSVIGEAGPKNKFIPTIWPVGGAVTIIFPASGASAADGRGLNTSGLVLGNDYFTGTTSLGETGNPWVVSGYPSNPFYKDLPRPNGTYEGRGFRLNDQGTVAGSIRLVANGTERTTLWNPQPNGTYVYQYISAAKNATNSDFFFPVALSPTGMVTGNFGTERLSDMGDWGGGVDVPRVYSDGVNVSLASLAVSTTAGYEAFAPSFVWDMNVSGVIVGNVAGLSGGTLIQRALIATPATPRLVVKVTFGNFAGDVKKVPVDLVFRTPGTTTTLFTKTAFPAADGSVTVDVPAGTYDIGVKATHWLRHVLHSVSFAGVADVSATTSLVNGDVDGNNVVTAVDRARVTAALGTLATASPASAAADLNGDGVVTAVDRAIVTARLGSLGDN